MRIILNLCLLTAALAFSVVARAYPEFIAYGYSSCLTCHYNGNGGGPLNDYGRALWSAEISSRALYPKSMSDEDIGNQSGFLGSTPLPYWLRPDIQYRSLELETNPGSSNRTPSRYFQMQTDFGLVLQNQSGSWAVVGTLGRLEPATEFGQGKQGLDHMMMTEYYVRGELTKTLWVYAGLLEKVFGLRNIDHMSYQRMYEGFNVQNDTLDGMGESEGVVIDKVEENWEVSMNVFFGNPYDDSQYKQSGASIFSEFTVCDNCRLGASLMTEKSDVLKKNVGAIHYRQQLTKGSALMFEWGLIQDTQPGQSPQTGSYNMLEAMVQLVRGYSLQTLVERYNQEFKTQSPDQWRWGFGLLMFPLPRLELRAMAINEREFSGVSTQPDSWSLEGQIHVSL